MAKSIAEYTAEVSKSYDNSRKALQNQIDAISGNLAQTQKQINENYANQQNQLNQQRNQAAESASMQAAGSGGSFGGAANIANRKYYEQTFVPAQTQLNTNQSQALENAQSQANNNRLTLETQMASMMDEISRLGQQRYYEELERERQEKLAKQQIAAQNAATAAYNKYANQAAQQDKYVRDYTDNGGYQFMNRETGNAVKLGTYMSQFGGNFDSQTRNMLRQMADNGDNNAKIVLATLNNNPNMKISANVGKNYKSNGSGYVNDAFNILGLKYN